MYIWHIKEFFMSLDLRIGKSDFPDILCARVYPVGSSENLLNLKRFRSISGANLDHNMTHRCSKPSQSPVVRAFFQSGVKWVYAGVRLIS